MKLDFNNVSNNLRLREYYYMLMRHKGIFAIIVAASVLCSTGIAMTLPKVYRAETVLLVQGGDILNPLIQGLAISPSVSHRLRSLKAELFSWERITLMVEKLGLNKGAKTPLAYERLIQNVRKNLELQMGRGGTITLAYEGEVPKQAQDIIKTMSDIIVEGTLTSQQIDTSDAIEFIEGQLDVYRGKLEESETRLREFKEVYMTSLPLAIKTNEQITNLKLELNQLLIDNTEFHPRVVATKNLISRLVKQRDNQMQQAKSEGVDIDPEDFEKLVSSVPMQEQHLSKLTRDYEVNARMYDSLLNRLETARLSETLEEADKGPKFKILEPARLPLEPVKPNKPLVALAGLFVGIGLGFVVIFLIDLSNTSIRSLDEAHNILDLPVFGSISPIVPDRISLEHKMRESAVSV